MSKDYTPGPTLFAGRCPKCQQMTQSRTRGEVPCKWGGCNGTVTTGPLVRPIKRIPCTCPDWSKPCTCGGR